MLCHKFGLFPNIKRNMGVFVLDWWEFTIFLNGHSAQLVGDHYHIVQIQGVLLANFERSVILGLEDGLDFNFNCVPLSWLPMNRDVRWRDFGFASSILLEKS